MASGTDAEEALRSAKAKDNFQLLTRLLMCGGVGLLREKFDSFHSPADLPLKLDDPATRAQLTAAKTSKPEWDCLYPSPGTFGKSTDFDITLTFRLLRTMCNLTTPLTGWNDLPNSADHSLEADLVRIKCYRNSVYGHNQKMEITDTEFWNLWKEIRDALLRIAGTISQAKRDEWETSIDKLLGDPLTTEAQRYVDELKLWYKNDMEVKDAVEQVRYQLQQVSMEVRDQQQQININARDQQQANVDIKDELQQVKQKLDLIIRISVESYSHSGQTISSSHSPNVPELPVAAGSERMVTVPIHQEQPQSEGAEGTSDFITYIWTVIKETCNDFLEYLRVLGVNVANLGVGSLLITVTCSSLQILEGLWKDYESGHLNKVAEQKLVTPQVLEKLPLSEVKLKTTISKEEYQKCKEFFLGSDQAHKQRQERAQEENDSRMKESRDKREPSEALRDAQEQKEQEGLLQLRHELKNYDFQKCPRIKKEAFQDLEVDDIDLVRIAVIGATGSGKTSFVGTLQRALTEPQTAMDDEREGSGSVILEEHYVQKKIRLIDTRGFLVDDEQLEDEILNIVSGRIRPGDEMVRNYDKNGDQKPRTAARKAPALSEYAHAVIFVVKANDPRLMDGKYRDKLQRIRETFCQEGYAPVTVITFLDKLKDKEDKDEAFEVASKATGSSIQRTFFITNYNTYEHDKAPFEVDRTALDILEFALLSAERFIQIRKQRERNQSEREVIAGGVPSGVETVDRFFSRVEKKYKWTDQGRTKAVLAKLRTMEINVVNVLKEMWNDIKSELPLIGMKIDLEEEMKHI